MTDELMIVFDEDGIAREYKDDYDITIHCENKEEQDEVRKRLTQYDWTPCSKRLPDDLIPVEGIEAFMKRQDEKENNEEMSHE